MLDDPRVRVKEASSVMNEESEFWVCGGLETLDAFSSSTLVSTIQNK